MGVKTYKILSLMVVVIMLLGVGIPTNVAFAVAGQPINAGDYTYTVDDVSGKATITYYRGVPSPMLVIPETLDAKTVVGIGDSAFKSKYLGGVVLPESLEVIGNKAFYMNTIEKVTIPKSVTSIAADAFGLNGWAGDSSGITDFEASKGGTWRIYSGSGYFWLRDTFDYDKVAGGISITGYSGTAKDVVIPSKIDGLTVTAIADGAMQGMGLTKVSLPDTVKSIGVSAFSQNSLTELVIPDNVTVIATEAFTHNHLSKLVLGSKLSTVGENVFMSNGESQDSNDLIYTDGVLRGTWNLVGNDWVRELDYTYTTEDGVATITGYKGPTGGSIVIPDTLGGCPVTQIGNSAFYLKGITGVTLPNTLVTIGNDAFMDNGLTGVTLPDTLVTIGGLAFFSNQITTLDIPDSVITVGENAFRFNGASRNSGNIEGSELAGTWNVVGTTWVKALLPQEPPTSVGTTASTLPDMSDGKLTGTTELMEYQTDKAYNSGSAAWLIATNGNTTVGPGIYWVRYSETSTHSASAAVKMTVGFKSPFVGGTGEIATPYQIETAAQLNAVRYFYEDPITKQGNNFILTKDIDLGVSPYNTGDGWVPLETLLGEFNGDGHIIKNMMINKEDNFFGVGLFEMILSGTVTNLGITGANITGNDYVGVLAGAIDTGAHIENVYVTGTVKGYDYVGGITGYLCKAGKTIKNCYALVNVTGHDKVGGLVGRIEESRIVNSYYVGNVTSAGIYKGGIVGEDYLVEHKGTPIPNIFTSNYYNATDTAGFTAAGGTSKSAVEMKNKATYLVGTGEQLWDFDSVWAINPDVNNGYPTLKVFAVAPPSTPSTPSGGGGSGGSGSRTTTSTLSSSVTVNGQKENAGKETTQTIDGKVQTVLAVDTTVLSKKIENVLKSKTDSAQNVVSLVISNTDNSTVQLTGDIVKKMETEDFNLSINKDKVEYKIPASEITIDKVAGILGIESKDLKDIDIEVKINKVSNEVLAKYNEIAKKFENEFIVAPVDFEIVAKTTGTDGKVRKTTVSKFSDYVERVLELPTTVDPSKITTGIVFNADGTYAHIPTAVFQKDGKWYAKLNSLTNSTYSVIYNPITVDAVKGHWSEKTVNDMASRLILIDYKNFDANEAVTRAEFADYIVRSLGLYREDVTSQTTFKDVTVSSENSKSIQIASDWGIISGYADDTFKANSTITREESMVMYARAMKIAKISENKVNKLATYTDNAEVAKWATSSVERTVDAGIFNGKGNGILAPKGTLTQAEALTAIRNLLVKAELISQ